MFFCVTLWQWFGGAVMSLGYQLFPRQIHGEPEGRLRVTRPHDSLGMLGVFIFGSQFLETNYITFFGNSSIVNQPEVIHQGLTWLHNLQDSNKMGLSGFMMTYWFIAHFSSGGKGDDHWILEPVTSNGSRSLTHDFGALMKPLWAGPTRVVSLRSILAHLHYLEGVTMSILCLEAWNFAQLKYCQQEWSIRTALVET